MSKVIDYYFTLISPWAYLGSKRLEEIAARHDAEIRLRPVDYSVIFPKTGGLPLPKRAPERQAYRLTELARWRDYLGVPLNFHPAHFPTPDKLASGVVIAAADDGADAIGLAHAIMRAVWVEDRNIAEADTLKEIATARGLSGDDLLAKAETPAVEAKHAAFTEEALARGVFGAPTYIYRDELFWGQDRVEFLDRALAA